MALSFESLRAEYADLWQRMRVRPERAAAVDGIAQRLIGSKARYQQVSAVTGVPWFFIAVAHQRESSANFNRHLHNGDPLTARTTHVPRGRPATGTPPFTWEQSAIDALTMPPHSLHQVRSWTIERICYEIERYNGFGYRLHHPEVKSPYLWSFSNIYLRGKYVADGHFDPSVEDQQCGTMPMLKRMAELDASVRFDGGVLVPAGDVDDLRIGSEGDRVRELQEALVRAGFQLDVDGDFGPLTAAAVRSFQGSKGLPVTGVADQATLQALEVRPTGTARPDDLLHILLEGLLKKGEGQQPAAQDNPLRLVIDAFLARRPAADPAAPTVPTAPVLSPIDKLLGGEALAGKKTILSVVAYVGLALLKTAGVVGAATPTGQIITILISVFGALGGISKVDRVIQTLGQIAAKPRT